MIDHQTQLNFVIGYPLKHTKSPLLHNTIYRKLNCNAIMLAHSTQDLSSSIQALKTLSVGLVAVTMPFKELILNYLDDMSLEVKQLKTANTVIFRNGKLFGYNTDIEGVAYALQHVSLMNKNVLIIGAGGASYAAAYFLQKHQANLFWLNRSAVRAHLAIDKWGGSLANIKQLDKLNLDILINTTPLGMFPDIHHSPLPDYIFQSHQVVFDMVYNPVETQLIQKAKSQGAICISGLEMFKGQGIKQIELWLNQTIDNGLLYS